MHEPCDTICSFQLEVTRNRGVIAATSAGVPAIMMCPMRGGVKNMVDATIPWTSSRSVGPHEAVVREIALKTACVHLVEVGGVGIHVTNDDCGRILRAQIPPLLQEHVGDPRMCRLRPSFIVVVGQMCVEEPEGDIAELEFSPRDGARGIIISRDGHPATAQEGDLAGVEQHVVLSVRLCVCRIPREARQAIPVLTLLKAYDGGSHCLDLLCIAMHPGIVILVLCIVAHHLQSRTTGTGTTRNWRWCWCARSSWLVRFITTRLLVICRAITVSPRGLASSEAAIFHPAFVPPSAECETFALTLFTAPSLALRNRMGVDHRSNIIALVFGRMRQLAIANIALLCSGFSTALANGITGIQCLVARHVVEHIACVVALFPSANTLAADVFAISTARLVEAAETIDQNLATATHKSVVSVRPTTFATTASTSCTVICEIACVFRYNADSLQEYMTYSWPTALPFRAASNTSSRE